MAAVMVPSEKTRLRKLRQEAKQVMEHIGGIMKNAHHFEVSFDYPAIEDGVSGGYVRWRPSGEVTVNLRVVMKQSKRRK